MAHESIDEGIVKDTYFSLVQDIVAFSKAENPDLKDRMALETQIKKHVRQDRPDWTLNLILEVINEHTT